LPDLVRDGVTGLLVPPRDERALAAAVNAALERAPALGRAAADVARGFGWPAAAAAIADLAATAICGEPGPC
jgi:glycosyltransferase involved in cell wall biosynthesis